MDQHHELTHKLRFEVRLSLIDVLLGVRDEEKPDDEHSQMLTIGRSRSDAHAVAGLPTCAAETPMIKNAT